MSLDRRVPEHDPGFAPERESALHLFDGRLVRAEIEQQVIQGVDGVTLIVHRARRRVVRGSPFARRPAATRDAIRTARALDADRQAAFTQDVLALLASHNRSGDRTLVPPSAYLEVVIDRK